VQPLRITHAQRAQNAKDQVTLRAERLQKAWQHASGGRRVERPSDDPTAIARILTYRSLLSGIEERRFQVEAGHSLLSTADGVLSGANALLIEAQELAVYSGSPGLSESDLRILGDKVGGLIEQLRDIAQTRYDNRLLFDSGATNTSAADLAGLDLGAEEIFAEPLAALERLHGELAAGDRAGDETLAALKEAMDALVGVHTAVGVRINRLESLQDRLLTMEHDLIERKSADEEVDLGWALIQLKEEETAYQTALTATAQLLRISLADFL
jgi:flagellar hook-associated protein 3 FlgL